MIKIMTRKWARVFISIIFSMPKDKDKKGATTKINRKINWKQLIKLCNIEQHIMYFLTLNYILILENKRAIDKVKVISD